MVYSLVSGVAATLGRQDLDLTKADQRIINATRDLALQCGTDMTIDQIAEHAGVSRSTVFRRFGTKDTVFEKMFRLELQAAIDIIGAAAMAKPNAIDRAIELITVIFVECVSNPLIRHLATNAPDELSRLGSKTQPSLHLIVRNTITDAIKAAAHELGLTNTINLELRSDAIIHLIAGYCFFPSGTLNFEDKEDLHCKCSEIAKLFVT